jgi:hypothetical protein
LITVAAGPVGEGAGKEDLWAGSSFSPGDVPTTDSSARIHRRLCMPTHWGASRRLSNRGGRRLRLVANGTNCSGREWDYLVILNAPHSVKTETDTIFVPTVAMGDR